MRYGSLSLWIHNGALWLFEFFQWLFFPYVFHFFERVLPDLFLSSCKMNSMHNDLKKKNLHFSKPRVLPELFSLFHYKSIMLLNLFYIMQNASFCFHHALWSRKKSTFFQAQGAVRAVVLIMQNELKNPYFSNQGCCLSCCSHYALQSHEKILIFPSLGCCHSFCSHDAKWAKKSFFFQS